MARRRMYIAKRSFHVDGVFVANGVDRVDGTHEWYLQFPENWEELPEEDLPEVEQATQAPGERRGEKRGDT